MDIYKPDWREARQRMCDWWAGKRTDRVVARVTSPRKGVSPRSKRDVTPEKYTDPETVFHNLDAELESTFYGGEAFPGHWVNLGAVPLGGCMGCGMNFQPDTVWQSRLYDSWDAVDKLKFDPSNRWYQLLCNLTRASLERSGGSYLVSGQGFGCVSDVIANMWGSENTLMAMAERPEAVKTATRILVEISKRLYDELDAITRPYQEGTIDWLGIWSPGRIWSLQSDISCMISPAMFEKYVLEELRQEAEHVDHVLYHLDGPGAIKHLDALLSLRKIDGIQWVPGTGASNDPMDWLDLFRRIQAAGKKVHIGCPPDRIKSLLNSIEKQGVFLQIVDCPDEKTARACLKELEKIGG